MELSPTKKALLALRQMQSKLDALERAKHEPIAVVGMGCRFPGANNPQEFWQLLQSGQDAITEVTPDRWGCDISAEQQIIRGGFIPHLKEFDPGFFRIAPKEAISIDPQQRLLLEVAWEALENAAIAPEGIRGSQTGVFVGIAAVDYWHQLLSRSTDNIDAYLTTGNTHSLASGRISHFFDFRGASISLDTACSSSLVAVHLAIKSLRDRECNLALAGGVNRLISPKVSINFARAKMLSVDGRCKTFDESANGFVRSEGCGLVVLKRLADAIADQDRIRGVLLGSAVNQDGRTSSITTPSSLSQQTAIARALTDSQLEARQISYLETHGTGTSLGDAIELEALSQVFANNQELVLGAVKTNIGHLESASGIASLIKTILAIEKQLIPPNLHLEQPNSRVEWSKLPFKLPSRAIAWQEQSRLAGVSSFGFSGTNAHIIIKEADALTEETIATITNPPDLAPNLYLVTLSGRTEKALNELAQNYHCYLNAQPNLAIADISLTSTLGRSHFNHRLAICASSTINLQTKLAGYLKGEMLPETYRGKAKANSQVCLLNENNNAELTALIKPVLDKSLVSTDAATVFWQLRDDSTALSGDRPKVIYTSNEPESNSGESLIVGLAQLYVWGVEINWHALWQENNASKITLPTYPFQRSTYWISE
ncbi:MAG: beta-ketoacyl synthase N-terminal-like domain-containing protein [Cyanobacteria bacterium J06623_7]